MVTIPDDFRDLLERPLLVALATVQASGPPQVTPVWADWEDGYVRINTSVGQQKYRNLVARPEATLLILDPDDEARYLEMRCRVARFTTDDGDRIIDKLASDYFGVDTYPFRKESEIRVTFYLEPIRINARS